MKKILLTALSALLLLPASAQSDLEIYTEKYGSENGIFLERREDVRILVNRHGELEISTEVFQERLLLNHNASRFAPGEVSFSGFIEVENLSPATLLPHRNGYRRVPVRDIQVVEVMQDNIFYDDRKEMRFHYPSLQPGAKTVLSYTRIYNEPRFFGSFFFSSYLPSEKSEISVTFPSDVKIRYHIFGIEEDELDFTSETRRNTTTYRWTARDMEKIHMEGGAFSLRHHTPHIILHVEEFTHQNEKHRLLSTVEDLHNWYYELIKDINPEQDERLNAVVDSLARHTSTELELVEKVYYWVQDNIRYIAIGDGLGGFVPRDAPLVFSRRYGDCKDMSSIIHQMLEYAGITSYLTWIGTREIPYSYHEVPTPAVDNHMICTYIADGHYYFLDATGSYYPMGLPTSSIQGKEALVHFGKGDFEVVTVPEISYEHNLTIDTVWISLRGGDISGRGNALFTGYDKIHLSSRLINADADRQKRILNSQLRKGNNSFSIGNFKTSKLRDRNSDLQIDYDFTIVNYARQNRDEIYINPHLDRYLSSEKINLDRSRLDKKINYRSKEQLVVILQVPEGHLVDYLPQNSSYDHPYFRFSMSYENTGDQIVLTQKVIQNKLSIQTSDFEAWNEMIDQLNAAYSEVIILKQQLYGKD